MSVRASRLGMKSGDFVQGIDEIKLMLEKLPSNIGNARISHAARKAAVPMMMGAKRQLGRHAKGTGGYSKVAHVTQKINIRKSKSKLRPGAVVSIFSADDVPVKGSRQGHWTTYGYGMLLAKGNYRDPGRMKRDGRNRGDFAGYGNYFTDAYRNNRSYSEKIFRQELIKGINRQIRRDTAKLAKVWR